MKYPFLPDFHAAFLAKAGTSMRDAMFIPGWLLCVSFVALLFLLNRRLLSSTAGASADRAALLSVLLVRVKARPPTPAPALPPYRGLLWVCGWRPAGPAPGVGGVRWRATPNGGVTALPCAAVA